MIYILSNYDVDYECERPCQALEFDMFPLNPLEKTSGFWVPSEFSFEEPWVVLPEGEQEPHQRSRVPGCGWVF
jgi:hypothetical protein